MLKLVSLNIELNKHFARNIPFLKTENPDVVCLQEVYEKDIPFIKDKLDFIEVAFAPMYLLPYFKEDNPLSQTDVYKLSDEIAVSKISSKYDMNPVGIALFSKFPLSDIQSSYYLQRKDGITHIHDSSQRRNSEGRVVLSTDITKNGEIYKIATTHFTWSPKGLPDEHQLQDAEKMIQILKSLGQVVVCGDFNAPRGGDIFSKISHGFKDNIPTDCLTTIDPIYHKAGKLEYVVDGIFSTDKYKVSDVKVIGGVSDHMALVASIKI